MCYYITRDEMVKDMVETWGNFRNLTCEGISTESMDKSDCNEVNFYLKYEGKTGQKQGNDCIAYQTRHVPNCDCSDPVNYDFYDEGRVSMRIRLSNTVNTVYDSYSMTMV